MQEEKIKLAKEIASVATEYITEMERAGSTNYTDHLVEMIAENSKRLIDMTNGAIKPWQ